MIIILLLSAAVMFYVAVDLTTFVMRERRHAEDFRKWEREMSEVS